jgi:hypothetical protein
MAVPSDPTDPTHLTPDQRLDEVAALLATGVRRLLSLRRYPPPKESLPDRLEVPPALPLHVSRPVNTAGERTYT